MCPWAPLASGAVGLGRWTLGPPRPLPTHAAASNKHHFGNIPPLSISQP